MSWMREGCPLDFFKGISKLYIVDDGNKKYNGLNDWDYKYDDVLSFCDLIGRFIKDATGSEEYAFKIVKLLAKRLKIQDKLRDHPLTLEEYDIEQHKINLDRKTNKWRFKRDDEM